RVQSDLHVTVERNDGISSEDCGEARKFHFLALEDVVLRVLFSIHQKQTVRHHTKKTMFFMRKNVTLCFEIVRALIYNQRQNVIETKKVKCFPIFLTRRFVELLF